MFVRGAQEGRAEERCGEAQELTPKAEIGIIGLVAVARKAKNVVVWVTNMAEAARRSVCCLLGGVR